MMALIKKFCYKSLRAVTAAECAITVPASFGGFCTTILECILTISVY